MKRFFALLISSLLLAACSSTDVITDYNPRADFARFQRFIWADELETVKAEEGTLQNSPFLKDHLRASLTEQLKNGLYQHVDSLDKADFIVRYYLLSAPDTVSRSPRLGIGLGSFSGHVGISSSVGIPLGKDSLHRNVQILIDLLDAKDKKLSWRGSLVIELDDQDPKENQIRIDRAVAEIWAQYPPK
jgi:hypothetical protein